VQWLYEPTALQRAGSTCTRATRRLGAAVPRQHHPPGTNDLVAGFDERARSRIDGKNESELETWAPMLRLRWDLGN
jgi:hypothetical protein